MTGTPAATRASTWGRTRDPPFELDCVGTGLLHEPCRGGERLLGRGLVGAERKVRDHQGARGAPHDGRDERHHLVDGDREGRVVAVDDHRGRVADQEHRDAGRVEQARGQGVVGGEHRPPLALGLGGGEVTDGDAAPGGAAVQALEGHGIPLVVSRPCPSGAARVPVRNGERLHGSARRRFPASAARNARCAGEALNRNGCVSEEVCVRLRSDTQAFRNTPRLTPEGPE